MLTIEVSGDASEGWGAQCLLEAQRQVVMALNRTARQAAEDIKADMPHRFTLRNKWVQKGIRVDNASIKNPEAKVYSVDPYMVKQETGELYRPDGHVAIPLAARTTPKSMIPRGMLPNALRGRSDVFKFDFSRNSTYKPFPLDGIFQRVMGGKHLRILYLLKDQKTTKPHWDFASQVEVAVDKYFERNFDEIRN